MSETDIQVTVDKTKRTVTITAPLREEESSSGKMIGLVNSKGFQQVGMFKVKAKEYPLKLNLYLGYPNPADQKQVQKQADKRD